MAVGSKQRSAPFVVALTGGIGSGKTTVAKLFETLGAGLVDTDEISHELTRPGGGAIDQIRQRFGEQSITADGALDRPHMRALVFQDDIARQDLEAILHPLIRARADERVRASPASYVVLVVPLLVEAGGYRELAQRVLVVDCDEALQVRRTMARSGLTEPQVRAIMASQAARAQRLAAADDVIINNGDLAELAEQVRRLHAAYLTLAGSARASSRGAAPA
jgi:dephospho-CoA kinase